MTAAFKRRKVDTERILLATRQSLAPIAIERTSFEIGQVYDVPLGRIQPNPLNSRALYTKSSAEKLLRSFMLSGQNVAACGFLDLAGDVILIDGLRRYQACEKLGIKTLRVEIRPLPETEQALYLASRSANIDREDQTALDDAIVWKGLIHRKVFRTQVVLASAIGIDEATVSRTLKLTQLPQPIIEALAEQPKLLNLKMLNAIRELCEVQGEEGTLQFIPEVIANRLSYRDVEARRKRLEQKPAPRARTSARRDLSFPGVKGHFKTFEKDGRLELTLAGMAPDRLNRIIEVLEKALQLEYAAIL